MEVEEVRQEEEQRSGQTTPTDSNREGEEILSDLDESNSNETDNSEESEKSFVEEIDVFEKIDPLPPTLLPYTLFFADSTWYVFFRQFHILCERLSRLYSESAKQNQDEAVARETYLRDDEIMELEVRPTPTYRELLDRLRLLLSGTIDYSQFEEESRSLFGIHAFVSFTMDKLVLSIVRQLQHVVTTESSKRATDLFIQNLKTVESAEMTSPIEASHLEHAYLNKVKKVLEEERCFKVVWLKQEKTLTIEILEQDSDDVYDPVETENWSNYVDNFVNPSVTCEEYLEDCEHPIPVILPRNLRKMKAYWKNKVANVEVSWQQRQISQYIKKNIMTSKKRKALVLLSRSLTKMSRRSSIQEGSVKSASSKAPSVVDDEEEEDAQGELKQRSDYVGTARRRLIPIEDSEQPEECEVGLQEESVQCADVEVEASLEVANPNIDVTNEELVETVSEESTRENLKQSQEATQEDIEICQEEDVDVNSMEGVLDTSQEEPAEVMEVEKSLEEAHASSQGGESTEGEAKETVAVEGEQEEMPVIVEEAVQVIGAESDLSSRTEAPAGSAATEEIESQEQEEENLKEEGQESEYEELEEEQNEDEELVVVEEQNEEVQEEEQKENEELEEDQEEEEEKQNKNEELQDPEDVLPEDEQCPSSPETTDQQESTVEEETPPKRGLRSLRRKPFDYSIRTRKNRANQAKKRMKRGIIRTLQSRRRKRRKLTKPMALDVLDDPKFDYNYFCELSEKEKLHYLLFLNVDVQDNIEVSFKPGCYKMHFVHGCDLYFYRGRSFTRTREVHQSISEIKTSNFNAWLRIWQERFVAPVLLKSCHDWLMKSEPGNYMMWRMNVGDCTKPPYIPYYKYKMRFFKKKLL